MQPPKSVIVTGSAAKPRVRETIDAALPLLRQNARVAAVDLDDSLPLETIAADLVLVFGGDGAILKAARRIGDNPIPVCGVKLGRLGFLATLTDDNLPASLAAIIRGEYTVTPAMVLDCTVQRRGTVIHQSRAVNDAVVSRGALSRLVSLDLLIDGEKVTTYNADGLIVSTPLGSTAHCLAAGGPIIEPGVEAMILAPICPHTLSNRPLAVPASRVIELEIAEKSEGIALTVDGQMFQALDTGDRVRICLSPRRFHLVRARDFSYYRTLREKLGWSGHLRG